MRHWYTLPLWLRITALYALFGLVWIIASDTLVQWTADTAAVRAQLQSYKGSFFVVLSAGLIGGLVYRENQRRAHIRHLLHELVDLAPDPAIVRRLNDGRIVEVNEEFARALGLSRERLLRTSISEFGEQVGFQPLLSADFQDENEVVNLRHTLPDSGDGPLEAMVSSRMVELGDKTYVCTFARDITDLLEAYEETIEGWARALALRDEETHAHALRVTNATVALARKLNVSEDEIPHIRRGALLHDIGKVGLPDSILHKDGKPTDEEWLEIRKHPDNARQLLEPIDYLRPAIDIPYHHHEKWDGSGYPEGLSGEDIPLAARIFAVVDVWDALSSDRPYRDAWPRERVRQYLEDGRGTHFDPDVLDAFLELEEEHGEELRDVPSNPVRVG